MMRYAWIFLISWGSAAAFCGLILWDQMLMIIGLLSWMVGLIVMVFS